MLHTVVFATPARHRQNDHGQGDTWRVARRPKPLTKQFNDLYGEFSRVALGVREFTPQELIILVEGTFFATLLLAFGYCVIRDRMRMETR
jgi:hypothetical protein